MCRFNEFWEAYPRKVAKKPAYKVWVKQKLDAKADEIIEAVQAREIDDPQWYECLEKGNLSFIPHPATYLNQERWEDEY